MVSVNVFVIAAAAVIWYFQQGDDQEGGPKSKSNPCCKGYCWAFFTHCGSVAFGSFILAVIWAIQIMMHYLEQKMKETGAAKNKFMECLFKYIHCCLACFERFIQFLNKQAYIQIALTGKSFCPAAWKAFTIILHHMVDFTMLATIGNGFMYIAILLICLGSGALAWLVMNQTDYFEQVSSIWFPIILVCLLGWMVGKVFASIYMVACYAILQSFYVDCELNKGSGKPPRNTPHELKEFVEKAKES